MKQQQYLKVTTTLYVNVQRNCVDILNLENQVLEEPLSVENILKEEVEIPDSVRNFYKALYTGEDEAKKAVSSRKSRFVESSASDAIYSCSYKNIHIKMLSR